MELYPRLARGEITVAEVMFARYRQGEAAHIERRPLFPLDFTAFTAKPKQSPPLHTLAPPVLLERLVGEYIFALLTEAAAESLASENAARFVAMEAAHRNVANKLDELCREAHRVRQDEITTELLDVVTGAEVLQEAATELRISHSSARCRRRDLRTVSTRNSSTHEFQRTLR